MSVTPPPGYGVYATYHRPTIGTHVAVNTFGFTNTGGNPANVAVGGIRTAGQATGSLFDLAVLDPDWQWTGDYCLVNVGGVLTSATAVVSVAGTAPPQTSPGPGTTGVIRKNTALAGKQYRGRIAYPAGFFSEGEIDEAGNFIAGAVTRMQVRSTQFFTAAAAAGRALVLLHAPPLSGPTPAPTVMTGFTATTLSGSARRRLR